MPLPFVTSNSKSVNTSTGRDKARAASQIRCGARINPGTASSFDAARAGLSKHGEEDVRYSIRKKEEERFCRIPGLCCAGTISSEQRRTSIPREEKMSTPFQIIFPNCFSRDGHNLSPILSIPWRERRVYTLTTTESFQTFSNYFKIATARLRTRSPHMKTPDQRARHHGQGIPTLYA